MTAVESPKVLVFCFLRMLGWPPRRGPVFLGKRGAGKYDRESGQTTCCNKRDPILVTVRYLKASYCHCRCRVLPQPMDSQHETVPLSDGATDEDGVRHDQGAQVKENRHAQQSVRCGLAGVTTFTFVATVVVTLLVVSATGSEVAKDLQHVGVADQRLWYQGRFDASV